MPRNDSDHIFVKGLFDKLIEDGWDPKVDWRDGGVTLVWPKALVDEYGLPPSARRGFPDIFHAKGWVDGIKEGRWLEKNKHKKGTE